MIKRIFISYAKEDKDFAEKLYRDLKQAGEWPWLDSVDLIPGQPWEATIRKAISDSAYFIALLSSRSVKKKGTVNKEISHAIDIAKELPEGDVFIIPARIDECDPSFEALKKLHWADLFPSYKNGFDILLRAFKYTTEEEPLIKVNITKQAGAISKLFGNGFGLIQKDEKEFFFYSNELIGVSFEDLRVGDEVNFSMAESHKGLVAMNVVERC